MNRNASLKYVFLAALAVLAVSALAGYPLLTPESAAGLGMLPFVIGETASVGSLTELIEKQGKAWHDYQAANDAARVQGVKTIEVIEDLKSAEKYLRDAGLSRKEAVAFIARVKGLSQSDSDEGDLQQIADALQRRGVPQPTLS